MAGVAQLVRASVCGTEGRGFKPHHSPHCKSSILKTYLFFVTFFMDKVTDIIESNKGVNMIGKVGRFFRTYRHFGLVLLAIIAGLVLDLNGKDKISHIILGATALISTLPLLWGMYEDLRTGKYGIDILAATAIVTSVILGEYWAGIIIVFMLTGGESLEDYAERRARLELDALLSRAPKKAHVLKGRKVVDVSIKQVNVGDKLIIKPGEIVPVDCVILEGETSIDESSLTGESLPIDKNKGDELLSGSLNVEGTLTVKALHTAADSQYEQIIELVRAAASTESPFVRLTDRYSVPFTILSFSIAGLAWGISGDPLRFLQVIVVATPCPLLLAAPIALISGMSRAAKHGIIIKTGSALEKLASVKTVGFDKTGTLTYGEPKISSILTFDKYKKNDILSYAASLEQGSTHVLAQAIVTEAEKLKIKVQKAKKQQEMTGHGIKGSVAGKTILVGKLKHLTNEGVIIPDNFNVSNINTTSAFVAVNGSLAGIISFEDELRSETKSMLTKLKSLGLKNFLMVTGDNKTVAQSIAKKVGITSVVAEALPADKVQAIESALPRPVAFVGDGVNDAPVLTASDVGIALGARGSTAASESADVVILLDDINQVATGIEIAKQTFKIARQAILIGIGMSIVLQLIFFTGRFKPVYGAALQEVVDVAVIFVALRAHNGYQRLKSKKTK